jgi:probable H4MPT-linked C1 transfer pathway protein
MKPTGFIGWDLGGAHLKLAEVDPEGRLIHVLQIPCPLWTGLQALEAALDQAAAVVDFNGKAHALTMTGELVDLFQDRDEGVRVLTSRMQARLVGQAFRVFAGRAGMITPAQVGAESLAIASANWFATARFAAERLERGVLVDIGSTTTDIIPFAEGLVRNRGYTDGERLQTEELVYTGVVRTPVMAVVRRAAFAGEWQTLVAERFATMGDIYQLTGQLGRMTSTDLVSLDTADGAGTEALDCARRLARMLGRDVENADLESWRQLAREIAWEHLNGLRAALARVLSREPGMGEWPFVGAGAGRFLARELATHMGHPYIDFSELCEGPAGLKGRAAVCAPAAALAYLARGHHAQAQTR